MDNDLLNIFFEESQEHLQALNENVLVLENNPANLAVVSEIFRSAHTFKGMSATMGYTEMADLTHKMENVLDEVRSGNLSVTPAIIDIIFECIDNLEKMVADVQAGGWGNIDARQTTNKIEAILSGTTVKEVVISEETATQKEGDAWQIHIWIREDAMLKAVRAVMCMEALRGYGDIVKTVPDLECIEADEFGNYLMLEYATEKTVDDIKEILLDISDVEKIDIIVPEKKEEKVVDVQEKATQTISTKVESRSIRVPLERIEKLMNMFEESVIERGRIDELAHAIQNKELLEHLNRLGDISKDIQNLLLNMRMVPIETVFKRFPRMVRSLAKDLGKKIDLEIIGEETEVDKIVIDEIGDSLVHLVRNAVDHGIETVEERQKAGKPETGKLTLEAFHSGNHVIIQISEDGRGIHKAKVLQRAISKGIISETEGAKLSEREIYELILRPGFSTAEVVSDLSGRGVGLDVVKHTIHSLGGQLLIDSEEGKGSTFRIELPLTLSIIQSMLIQTEQTRYAIPLGNIVEAIRIQKEDIQILQGRDVLNYRDQIIEIIELGAVFGEDEKGQNKEEKMVPVLILKNARRVYGLIVKNIIGQREIVLKSLGDFFADSSAYFSGATILGDGKVVLILNPDSF
ncbi:chemotaxis protein CheA [Ectobacillus antri]|uniref:Chemotaxis protein CheA n=1 Tax=Ectobacillus antri TaxID=2486280 RepID=A0ABT6H230_9BACI|nr:chemotaxis protein CheA [Ectobacillus antri]MDG4656178.1 chemotaxis protein CheA [Ectobacillus antri]MDG5752853.1 chemotaxis protein CheA [Ectobacillus antri]